MTKLIQITGPVVDLVYRVREIPASGEEGIVTGFLAAPGGGANSLVAARAAGMEAALGGTIGTGPFAEMTRKLLAEQAIPHIGGTHPDLDQGLCTVLLEPDGERTFVSNHGAEGHVTEADLARIEVSPGDWVMLSGYTLFYPAAARAVSGWISALPPEIKVLFDPSPIVAEISSELLAPVFARADWISANFEEGVTLVGFDKPGRVAMGLARNRQGAVLRRGADGAWLATEGRLDKLPAPEVKAIDSNGAGDCHIGSFIAELTRSGDPLRATRYANIAAALSTTRDGPATPPPRDEVMKLL
ncbi:MAG TPA: PfkB family carbohydrate kinase [Paracoccus sp. (in: a-proteobacteria)]|uniref:PfkB family carbohydrate kinase n=1 Tax=uncultured Paracoccus sp. TaxID=189685 RepID=UPI00261CC217|nr:PfkB family carbohydrate kinase [uncultured Paracoccus sp.]HMQ40554.1 PfkB family carbohydrate kinase [Paracoccus sp. (in: a-proteobacteria)]HMR34662.1 PfkB family carbohydrate kinase [Paracoccus sp. (in: a-proteobacteria)]